MAYKKPSFSEKETKQFKAAKAGRRGSMPGLMRLAGGGTIKKAAKQR